MSFTAPYQQHNYLGEHADDAAALTWIQSSKWDSNLDGTGSPRNGMWFYRTSDDSYRGYQGGAWKAIGGVPAMIKVSASGVAEGNNSIAGFKNKAMIASVKIVTLSTDWELTLYESDDYSTSPHVVVGSSLGNLDVVVYREIAYEDQDATEELHYTFTDNAGSATHDIEVRGYELS
jgi:hypothetical protein